MTIKDAKEQIKNAMLAYFTKDEFGNYVIPIERQRPVFMIGPPGIGKTAIMQQIAQELDVGLVSYSMTHHTRQSALGLPFIVHKTYRGQEYDVSKYTMSEILSSVYDRIEHNLIFSFFGEGFPVVKIPCLRLEASRAVIPAAGYKQGNAHTWTIGDVCFLDPAVVHR